jgi:butyrate kinase
MEIVKILVINPGSTSTKIAVYDGPRCSLLKTMRHTLEELSGYKTISEQFDYRYGAVINELERDGVELEDIDIVMGRGGLTYPLESGVYEVNEKMVEHCRDGVMGMHASNLGAMIAFKLAALTKGRKAFMADPVVTDEMDDIARVTGHPEFERLSIFHALNQKAVARQHAEKLSKSYEEMNLIVVHLGGGISVGAHRKGRVVDVNNALDGEGPFSPERSGSLPVGSLIDKCFSGKYSFEEIRSMVVSRGGFVAYLGTNNAHSIEIAANGGDEKAIFYREAMAYQVAKTIGEMSTVLKGDVDGILLTGGIAYDKSLMAMIRERVEFISNVFVYPGQDEMKSLAMNALMVYKGDVEAKEYNE